MTVVANAQPTNRDEPPPACANASSEEQYRACVEATEPGTGFHWLSLMHLGMIEMQRQDLSAALEIYDSVGARRAEKFTRPRLHAYRAAAYQMAGRDAEALSEARVAVSLLQRTIEMPDEVWPIFEDSQINNEVAYSIVLPILHEAGDPLFDSVLSAYEALPVDNWASAMIRASAFEKLDRLDEALGLSRIALASRPDHPLGLNNHCYILVRLARPAEKLPYCERAVALMPESAILRGSYASALAALGRCPEAAAQDSQSRRLDAVSVRPDIVCTPL